MDQDSKKQTEACNYSEDSDFAGLGKPFQAKLVSSSTIDFTPSRKLVVRYSPQCDSGSNYVFTATASSQLVSNLYRSRSAKADQQISPFDTYSLQPMDVAQDEQETASLQMLQSLGQAELEHYYCRMRQLSADELMRWACGDRSEAIVLQNLVSICPADSFDHVCRLGIL